MRNRIQLCFKLLMIHALYLISDVRHCVFDVYAHIPKISIKDVKAAFVLSESNLREVLFFIS